MCDPLDSTAAQVDEAAAHINLKLPTLDVSIHLRSDQAEFADNEMISYGHNTKLDLLLSLKFWCGFQPCGTISPPSLPHLSSQ